MKHNKLFGFTLFAMFALFLIAQTALTASDRDVADQNRAKASDLRQQAAEKDALIAEKDKEIASILEGKGKVDIEIIMLERNISQQKRERDDLNSRINVLQEKWNSLKKEYDELGYESSLDSNYAGKSGIKSESEGPISDIKTNLNAAADGLDSIANFLKGIGLSDDDVNKLFSNVGIDPRKLSQNIKQIANAIPGGPMTLYELNRWDTKLFFEYLVAKAQQGKARGPDYDSLKQQVAEYDAQISYEEAQVRFWKSRMAKHEENARKAWKPCNSWKIFECIWNIPGVVHEKFLAPAVNWLNIVLGAEKRINELKTWRSIPAGRIALADAAAAPYTLTVDTLKKEMDFLKEARKKIKDKIEEKRKQIQKEAQDTDNKGTALVRQRNSINEAIKPTEERLKTLKNTSNDLKQKNDKLQAERAILSEQKYHLLSEAFVLENSAEIIEATSPARAGEPCNPGIAHYQQPGCIENATPSGLSDWDGLPCPGDNVPNYAKLGCIPISGDIKS